MKRFQAYVFMVVLVIATITALSAVVYEFNHYREAVFECQERCDPYAPNVAIMRNGYTQCRACYCDTEQHHPDLIHAQERLDTITSVPPADFHI